MIHLLFIIVGVLLTHPVEAAKHPNVLMISVDDMNDWTSVLGGYGGKVHTPNLERLAKRAVNFTNAHTASPVCCPEPHGATAGPAAIQHGHLQQRPMVAAAPAQCGVLAHVFSAKRISGDRCGQGVSSYRRV